MRSIFTLDIGATPVAGDIRFRVRAPAGRSLLVELMDADTAHMPPGPPDIGIFWGNGDTAEYNHDM